MGILAGEILAGLKCRFSDDRGAVTCVNDFGGNLEGVQWLSLVKVRG